MNRLLVTGFREDGSPYNVDRPHRSITASPAENRRTQSVLCRTPNDLPSVLGTARLDFFHGAPIDVLELFDHARFATQQLGDSLAFYWDKASDALVGDALARQIARHLAPTAYIRLLGCSMVDPSNPTRDQSAARFICELARSFGALRTVQVSTIAITEEMFDQRGLKAHVPAQFLYSSALASSGIAPMTESEQEESRAVLGIVGSVDP